MLCLRILHVCKRAGDTFTNMMFHNHFGVNDIKCVTLTGNSVLTHDMYSIHMHVIVRFTLHSMVCEFANVNQVCSTEARFYLLDSGAVH